MTPVQFKSVFFLLQYHKLYTVTSFSCISTSLYNGHATTAFPCKQNAKVIPHPLTKLKEINVILIKLKELNIMDTVTKIEALF